VERQPEKMAAALQIHNAALRGAIEATRCRLQGLWRLLPGGLTTALQALKAAIAGQRALPGPATGTSWECWKVRMGLHTGEAELDPGETSMRLARKANRVARDHVGCPQRADFASAETGELVNTSLCPGRASGTWVRHH